MLAAAGCAMGSQVIAIGAGLQVWRTSGRLAGRAMTGLLGKRQHDSQVFLQTNTVSGKKKLNYCRGEYIINKYVKS